MWALPLLTVIQSGLTSLPMEEQNVNWTMENLDTANHLIINHGSAVANTPSPLEYLMD